MYKNELDSKYDLRIIEALKKLKVPLKTFDDHIVLFDLDKRHETIYEHISNKKHHLHLKDIALIPSILNNRKFLKRDRNGEKFRSYICKRTKRKERLKYLKIITKITGKNKESIITICIVKNNH